MRNMANNKNNPKNQEKNCGEENCPRHGSLKLRGREFSGTVISSKASKTATVEWERRVLIPKYERYEKKRSRVKVHNPSCIDAKEGDRVRIKECRPISKTKKFCITEVLVNE